jgi:hypothetical protein
LVVEALAVAAAVAAAAARWRRWWRWRRWRRWWFGGFNLGLPLEAGTYQVKLTVNGRTTQPESSSKTIRM